MNRPRMTIITTGIAGTFLALLISAAFPVIFEILNQTVLTTKYLVRGETEIDSSISILFFDDEEISSLGGMPLKRSYYALVVHALHDLGAKAIGIDITFSEPDNIHPEYDDLFASEIQRSENVVLSGYFKAQTRSQKSIHHRLPDRFRYNVDIGTNVKGDEELYVPFEKLLRGAAGFGHTNFTDDNYIPLFLSEEGTIVPAFALELLRLGVGFKKSQLELTNSELSIYNDERVSVIPMNEDGNVLVNYMGGTSSLNLFPAIEFLQSYDAVKDGYEPSLPIERVRGGIVLVGIIAEGRSPFLSTPFTTQFPSIGIHAMFLDNALRGRFLRYTPHYAEYFLAFAVGFLSTLVMILERKSISVGGIITLAGFLVTVSYFLFIHNSYELPLVRSMFTIVTVTASVLLYEHQSVRRHAHLLVKENEQIALRLREKGKRLQELERELYESKRTNSANRIAALEDEIEQYKIDILSLKVQAEDIQPFVPERDTKSSTIERFHGIIYNNRSAVADVIAMTRKIADSDATVLLLGESGTGKELVARAIHQSSRRKERAFVAVNCGALTETLLESELFGHEKGAFTGAIKEKMGRFELANGGTIFLDEIADTSEAFQVKLLHVLQDGTFERVGGIQTRKVDVRVIAATNRDIRKCVEEKKFREDLYYRLNVFTLQLPPLRDRVSDIPPLVEHFISLEGGGMSLSSAAMKLLLQHQWRGNVRELQSAIKRAVLLAKSSGRTIIRVKDLPEEFLSLKPSLDIEEQIIISLHEKEFARNAISETADELGGLNRGTVAEYFRGFCFKMFVENHLHIPSTIDMISSSSDQGIRERLRRKIAGYLQNAVELVDRTQTLEEALQKSRPKYKNLPLRYHQYLDVVLKSYHRREWDLRDFVQEKTLGNRGN